MNKTNVTHSRAAFIDAVCDRLPDSECAREEIIRMCKTGELTHHTQDICSVIAHSINRAVANQDARPCVKELDYAIEVLTAARAAMNCLELMRPKIVRPEHRKITPAPLTEKQRRNIASICSL